MSEKQPEQLPVYSTNNAEDPTSRGHPAGTTANVVNILPPANAGQQYIDQCNLYLLIDSISVF